MKSIKGRENLIVGVPATQNRKKSEGSEQLTTGTRIISRGEYHTHRALKHVVG